MPYWIKAVDPKSTLCGIFLRAASSIVAAMLLATLLTGCDRHSSQDASRKPLVKGDREICTEGAARRKKEVGRPPPYNQMVSKQPFVDRAGDYADAYLGDTYIKAPLGYLNDIDGGNDPKDGGQSIIYEAYLPDLKPHPVFDEAESKQINPFPRNVIIYANCRSKTFADSLKASSAETVESLVQETRNWQVEKKLTVSGLVPLPDLGLLALPLRVNVRPFRSAYYFPLDPTFKSPTGGLVYFDCSGDQKSETRQQCIGSVLIKPNIFVIYNFPYQWLDHWRQVYEFVVEVITSNIQG